MLQASEVRPFCVRLSTQLNLDPALCQYFPQASQYLSADIPSFTAQ